MALTDSESILAGMRPLEPIQKNGATAVVGRLQSLFYAAGMPGAAVAPTPGVGGAALTSYAGQIPFTNPVSGETRLSGMTAAANVSGALLLCDRLWHNSGLSPTLTTSQTVNSVALPARDKNETINGAGIQCGIEVSGTMGAGTPTFTIVYTNTANVTGRTVVSAALPATMAAGSFIPLALAAGDVGCKSVQSIQLSATMTSGTFHLVAYRVLAMIAVPATGNATLNALQLNFPKLADNTVPFMLWLPSVTTAPGIFAQLGISQG
jgi:hypothetical protein